VGELTAILTRDKREQDATLWLGEQQIILSDATPEFVFTDSGYLVT
jgi:hypothetical protein